MSSDGNVRVQKNVIATDEENVFDVYLSVDTKSSFAEYFRQAEYMGFTHATSGMSVGEVVTPQQMNESHPVYVSTSSSSGYDKHGQVDIYEGSTLIADDVTLYWDQANMFTLCVKLTTGANKGNYLVLGANVSAKGPNDINIAGSKELIIEEMVNAANLHYVDDYMGSYISYMSESYSDGSVSKITDGIRWEVDVKSNPETDVITETVDGKEVTTTWYLNVAELMYKVKLNVDQTGFQSCADTINDKAGSPKYDTNSSAVLYYGDNGQVAFPQPKVRGLLYDVLGEKLAYGTNAPLDGATFQITPSDPIKTATSSDGGKFAFVGLPWGEYTVTETAAPKGYQLDSKEATVALCYTDAPDSLVVSTEDGTHMMAKDQTAFTFVDKLIQPTIVLVKQDLSGNPLNGAEFTVTGPNDFSASGVSAEDGTENYSKILVIEKAETGEYNVKETKAPVGYEPADDFVITVPSDGSDVTATPGSKSVSKIDKLDNDDGSYTYIIYIVNNPGIELPATGGMGTVAFTVSGLMLMAAAMILLSKQRKRFDA